MMRLALVLLAWPVSTAALALDLPGDAERRTGEYTCSDGAGRSVEYVNLPHHSLALLPVDGVRRVFVNVASGSGARYVSSTSVWWSKGAEAMLEDERAAPSEASVTCREQGS